LAALGSITLPARKLQEAVSIAVPSDLKRTWRKKVWPLNLLYDTKKKEFSFVEARHELAGFDIAVAAKWPIKVQVNGAQFRHVIETYKPNEILTLTAFADRLEIASERSPFSMPRMDALGKQGVSTTPIKPNKRHKGKVHVEEYAPIGRVEKDATWGFSARMPVPHHQYPDGILPPNGALSPPSEHSLERQTKTSAGQAGTLNPRDQAKGTLEKTGTRSDVDEFRRIARTEIDAVARAFEHLRPRDK